MPRPSNTGARRTQIVRGLLSAMAKHGYAGASIQLIAKEARLTPGLIHYHFESKQEILVESIRHLTGIAEARYAQFAPKSASPEKRLEALIDAYLAPGEGASPQAVAAWVVIGAEAIKQKEVRTVYEQVIATRLNELTELLKEILESKGRPSKDGRKIAAALLSLIEGAFQLSSAAPEALPRGYAAETAKKLVSALLD